MQLTVPADSEENLPTQIIQDFRDHEPIPHGSTPAASTTPVADARRSDIDTGAAATLNLRTHNGSNNGNSSDIPLSSLNQWQETFQIDAPHHVPQQWRRDIRGPPPMYFTDGPRPTWGINHWGPWPSPSRSTLSAPPPHSLRPSPAARRAPGRSNAAAAATMVRHSDRSDNTSTTSHNDRLGGHDHSGSAPGYPAYIERAERELDESAVNSEFSGYHYHDGLQEGRSSEADARGELFVRLAVPSPGHRERTLSLWRHVLRFHFPPAEGFRIVENWSPPGGGEPAISAADQHDAAPPHSASSRRWSSNSSHGGFATTRRSDPPRAALAVLCASPHFDFSSSSCSSSESNNQLNGFEEFDADTTNTTAANSFTPLVLLQLHDPFLLPPLHDDPTGRVATETEARRARMKQDAKTLFDAAALWSPLQAMCVLSVQGARWSACVRSTDDALAQSVTSDESAEVPGVSRVEFADRAVSGDNFVNDQRWVGDWAVRVVADPESFLALGHCFRAVKLQG